jgi:hypothetical protein
LTVTPPPEEQFARLVAEMVDRSEATYGGDESKGARRSFGATSLKVKGKIFAMLVKERLVVKLSAGRVSELVASGAGEPFDPGHGRIQREWVVVSSSTYEDWLSFATESETWVGR